MPGKTVWAIVLGTGNMNEFEMKRLDANDPSVHRHSGLNVWVIQHALNIACINFHMEVSNTDYV